MSGKRRSKSQWTRDRRKIADLYLQGFIQADIADKIGVCQQTISNDLKSLHKEWIASALVDFDEAKAQELAKIDRLEREYWAGWDRSREDAETSTAKVKGDGDKEATKTVKGQAGDPRFLAGIQWCIDRRCKILGVDAPKRHEITGEGGEPLTVRWVNDWRRIGKATDGD